MNYTPKTIENKTAEELRAELRQMQDDEYAHGRSIDRPRLWDILHTLRQLEAQEEVQVNG